MTTKNLGRYEIIGELGKGAMGLVYLARDPLIGRQLALKTFRMGLSAQDQELEQFRVRFLREAQSAGILSHPNIVTIHDVVVENDGDFFIAMEYVKGTDLKHLMQKGGRLDLRFVIDIVAQIADGLDYAHSQGVVHRDIKPANIIITKKKQAKITDFGIARIDASNLTTEGQLLGTPNYMAPEQIQGKEVDHRTDLFSLGVMLYELVTGKKPFRGDNLTQVTHRIVYDSPTAPEEIVPGLPASLLRVIDRALRKDPAERYERGGDMAGELRAILAPAASSSGSTGSFLADDPNPPSGQVAVGSAANNMTLTSAAAHAALKPSATTPNLSGTFVSPPPEAAATPPQTPVPPPESPAASKPHPALVVVAAVALLAVIGVLAFSLLSNRADSEAPTFVDPEAELRARYEPLVEEGERLLEAGDPERALVQFEKALAIVPEDREIRQLRQQAERASLELAGTDPEEAMVLSQLRQAREALDARDYRQVIRLAEGVLELDPENQDAEDLLQQGQEGQGRRDQVRDRFRNNATAPAAPAESGATAPPATRPASAKATLKLDFFSEAPEGRLTIYADSDRIYQESFKFEGEKKGLLQRRASKSGRLSASFEVPAGPIHLAIYAKAKDQGTRTTELDGDLPADGATTLTIRMQKDGRVTARLE